MYADGSGEVPVTLEFPQGTETWRATSQEDQEWHWTAHFEAFVSRFDLGDRPRATPAGHLPVPRRGRAARGRATRCRTRSTRATFEVEPVERDHGRGPAARGRSDALVPRRAANDVLGRRTEARRSTWTGRGRRSRLRSARSTIPIPTSRNVQVHREPAHRVSAIRRRPGIASQLEWFCFTLLVPAVARRRGRRRGRGDDLRRGRGMPSGCRRRRDGERWTTARDARARRAGGGRARRRA